METVVAVIIEQQACYLGTSLSEEVALTLIAVASEDPSGWGDIVASWPRYRTPVVPEFADGVPLESVDYAVACGALQQHDCWVVIDLVEKKITTGRSFERIGRDEAFALEVDESGKQQFPLSIHLPPWWEMIVQTDTSAIGRDRAMPLAVMSVRREVLFGEPLLEDLAARILDVVETEDWMSAIVIENGTSEQERSRYDFTIQVHRDWLMTPRQDLDGLMPRQMLHGGHEWIDRLVWAQQIRFQDGGKIVALPTNVTGYENAPMGSEEVIIYFDLCRELIGSGWEWCIENRHGSHTAKDRPRLERQLIAHLNDVKQQWLSDPYEGGSPPQFIIECSRRRVPRGAAVPIVGMAVRESEQHVIDCDCPICNMMADGMFGTSFSGLDGHHLDLDEEFAFSLHETRKAWQQQQQEFAEMSARIDAKLVEREASGEMEPEPFASTPFASTWSGLVSDDPIPGDSQGHLKLAFLLAEVVGMLQSAGASSEDIKRLNTRFTDFRKCELAELPTVGKRFADHLETLSQRYPELVSRLADLQSRIDELIRCDAIDGEVPR